VIGILFLYLVGRDILHGPGAGHPQVVPAAAGLAGEAG